MLSMPRIVRPDPWRFLLRAGNRFPRWIDNSADPLSETKNYRKFLTSLTPSQVKPLYS
jgi:hypothetical protein